VSLWLAHKYRLYLLGIQQDSFESLLMMLVHKYQVDFSDIHLDITLSQINLGLAHSFRLDFYDIQ
jgi:hypothetical protein